MCGRAMTENPYTEGFGQLNVKNVPTKFRYNTTRRQASNQFLNYIWGKCLRVIIAFQSYGKIVTLELEQQTDNKNKLLKDQVTFTTIQQQLEYTPEVLLIDIGENSTFQKHSFLPLTDKKPGLDELWVGFFLLLFFLTVYMFPSTLYAIKISYLKKDR